MAKFIKGVDLSTLQELEQCGAVYSDQGEQGELLDILKRYEINSVRLRLWNDPYSKKGEPYGAGTNDLNTTIETALRVVKKGFGFLLDFHYSDFWADPQKQFKPKAWEGMSVEELEEAVFTYTKDCMMRLIEAGAKPDMVQVGNELSNGLLWPEGKVPNYENIARFVNAGIRGVKAADNRIPIMLHLDNGGNNALYREWFDEFVKRGEAFDVIGLSYYPFWHGSLQELEENMQDISRRYQKDVIVAEVSMGFTMEDYGSYEQLKPDERKGYATKPELVEKIEYPMTKQGQADFMQDIMTRIANIEGGRGKGFYYWEPAWIPVCGSGWAKPAGLSYIQDPGPGGNEWANQALFDYDGNVLPALRVIRDFA
ncbi:MAG: glycosyl hydrolase [Lachnospiraceae bacterium]|nr:glycosyl hydrolase [Lachnospiraceae bacterium]